MDSLDVLSSSLTVSEVAHIQIEVDMNEENAGPGEGHEDGLESKRPRVWYFTQAHADYLFEASWA